jgi:hypothetical protein
MQNYPELLAKWEEKKGPCNMAIVDPFKDQKSKQANLQAV